MSTIAPSITSKNDFDDTPQGWQRRWLAELAAAKKAAEKWQKAGDRITKVFLDERGDSLALKENRLNVFSSNVITLRAMLFGNVPRVEVGRRYDDANDDAARVAAEMLERIANADIAKQFSYAIGTALDDRLLPGIGVARVRYDAKFESVQVPPFLGKDGTELAPGYEDERKTFEAAPVDYINWRDVLWSPARTWDEVRWIAFRNYMTQDQCVERFGERIGKSIPLGTTKRSAQKGIEHDPWQKAEVWEIWCLEHRKVYWIAEGMDVICDAKDDPLGLTGFFPCPQFMIANVTSKQYAPRADYILAQDQYDELNELTTRIGMIERAIRVSGVYDKQADGVQRLLTEGGENTLIPVDNWAMFAEKGGIKGQVDWFPLEMVVNALDKLREYRREVIELLYQVTGMSDIMRGASNASETATAQSIKAKFASVRVQSMQDDFARFATDLQRLRIEVICNYFDDATIIAQSNMQGTPDEQYIPEALQLLRKLDAFRISIKSETLAAQDMAAIRQEKTEFIQGLAQFLGAAQPLIDKYPAAAPTLLEMLKWTMSGFKGASTIEGVLDKAIANLQQNPPQSPPDPNAGKDKAAQIKVQGDLQREQMRTRGKMQEIAANSQADLRRIGAENQAAIREQAAQFAFSTAEQQRQHAMDAASNVVAMRRPAE